MMKRPSDEEIFLTLSDKAPADTAAYVARWFATPDGREWLDSHASDLFDAAERGAVDAGVPGDVMLDKIEEEIDRIGRRRRFSKIAMFAAVIVIPLVIFAAGFIHLDKRTGGALLSSGEIVTETSRRGEVKEVVFQDGTRVRLNAGTSISYPRFWGFRSRSLTLEGEAFFDVVPNPGRPFIVNVGSSRVKVLGTKFNVKAYDKNGSLEIFLQEGVVEFESGGRSFMMKPNEVLKFDGNSGDVKISCPENGSDSILWTENVISFRSSGFADVARSLERWYDVVFEVVDTAAFNRNFTFRTVQLPLHSLLDELEYISDLRFSEKGDTVTVTLQNM